MVNLDVLSYSVSQLTCPDIARADAVKLVQRYSQRAPSGGQSTRKKALRRKAKVKVRVVKKPVGPIRPSEDTTAIASSSVNSSPLSSAPSTRHPSIAGSSTGNTNFQNATEDTTLAATPESGLDGSESAFRDHSPTAHSPLEPEFPEDCASAAETAEDPSRSASPESDPAMAPPVVSKPKGGKKKQPPPVVPKPKDGNQEQSPPSQGRYPSRSTRNALAPYAEQMPPELSKRKK